MLDYTYIYVYNYIYYHSNTLVGDAYEAIEHIFMKKYIS